MVFGRSLNLFQFIIPLLIIPLQISNGGEAREMSNKDHHVHHQSEASASYFFDFEDIKPCNKVPFFFEKRASGSASRFLPRAQAKKIPFSSKQLPDILRILSVAPGSKMADDMADTLKGCEIKPITAGQTRFCATSAESLLETISTTFGIKDRSDHPTVYTSTFHSTDLDIDYQNFTVLAAPQEIAASKMIGCHLVVYPYTIYFCHTTDDGTKGFHIYLRGDNGDEVSAVAVCQMDTSKWDPSHRSFSELGTKPGDPVCKMFPPHGNLLYVHAPHLSS